MDLLACGEEKDWRPVGGEIDVLVPAGVDLSRFEHEMSFVEAVLVSTCVVEDHVWFEDRWIVASLCD
jgi:hypothetical protein